MNKRDETDRTNQIDTRATSETGGKRAKRVHLVYSVCLVSGAEGEKRATGEMVEIVLSSEF